MAGFGNKDKVNNAAGFTKAKAELRRRALAELGPEHHVFDAFAGEGTLHDLCYRGATSYVGCDRVWYRDQRRVYVADNLRLMRAIDLTRFNLFDLDAYGSPWKQWLILLARRPLQPGEKIAVILTEGTASKLISRTMDHGLAEAAGIAARQYGAKRRRHDIINRAISRGAKQWQAEVTHRWQVDRQDGAQMSYIALVLARPAA